MAVYLNVPSSYMLKKTERLNRAAFSTYFASGKRTHGTYLTIITAPAGTLLSSVVVGKKVSKKAPTRNSIKRRIYAQVGTLAKKVGYTGVVIIITKPGVIHLSKKDFQVAIGEELGRVIN
jgi:ribonuclease P protein component